MFFCCICFSHAEMGKTKNGSWVPGSDRLTYQAFVERNPGRGGHNEVCVCGFQISKRMQYPEGGWEGAKSCREVGCCRKVRPWNGGGGLDWVSVEAEWKREA